MEEIHRDFIDAYHRFDNWLTQALFPKWASLGFAKNGAALERFGEDGLPDWHADKRLRVQARQIFSVSYGYKNGFLPQGKSLVKGVNRFIDEACQGCLPGYYPMSLDAENKVKNSHSDLYDIAFFLLAFAWQKDAFDNDKALDNAKALVEHVNITLGSKTGGWQEGTYDHNYRRQNPHMHMFEAFIHLYKVSKDRYWLAQCERVFTLFEKYFFDAKHGVLLEYFTLDWQVSSDQGFAVEPGHMMEWVWLLNQYEALSGVNTERYQKTFYENARKMGLAPGGRWLVDTVTPEGKPVSTTFKSWPMTEWIKAALVRREKSATPLADIEDATFAIHQLIDGFSHPEHENHYMYVIAADGSPVEGMMPASTLYHLCMAHYECKRLYNTLR